MSDIFDNPILCKKCKAVMKPCKVEKNGFVMRAVGCKKCKEIVIHPVDKQEYSDFIRLRKKDFSVKMRMVGNSYAVSIPREIVDFLKEQEKVMDDMVRLCFEDAKRISLMFGAEQQKQKEKELRERHR